MDGTTGFLGMGPSISPDGSEVVFGGRSAEALKVVRLDGGPVRALMTEATISPFWASDGYVYAYADGEGIFRVPATGGTPEQVSRLETTTSIQELTDLLPGGRSALVSLVSGAPPATAAGIAILDLQTAEMRRVVAGQSARYVEPGYLVFIAEDRTLSAARFDAGAGEMRGPVVPLLEAVSAFSLSDTGTLLYAPLVFREHEFVWVSRDGVPTPAAPEWTVEGLVDRGFALSPDEGRLALSISDGAGRSSVWVKELPRGATQRVTSSEADNWGPQWQATGDRITYTSGAGGGRVTLSRRSNGTGPVDTLFDGSLDAPDAQVDRNGEWLVLRVGLEGGRERYIAAGRLGPGANPPFMILGGTYNAVQPALSPDGRWIAYTSDESGRNEVYLRPFPDVDSDRIVVSTEGGMQPRWSRDGTDLFYLAGEVMMVARIEVVSSARVLSRDSLFTMPSTYLGLTSYLTTNYDVAADGRFLMARPVTDNAGNVDQPGLIVVQNWIEELTQAVGR
jgi:serine/threonine-protein kinase